jgi:hypothetical protein
LDDEKKLSLLAINELARSITLGIFFFFGRGVGIHWLLFLFVHFLFYFISSPILLLAAIIKSLLPVTYVFPLMALIICLCARC